MFWEELLNNAAIMLLILARVIGIFSFNPIFGRANIPNVVKAGLGLALAVLMFPTLDYSGVEVSGLIPFAFSILLETLIGMIFGFVINLFITIIGYAGEVIDTQIGLSMARVMDPATGVSMPLYATAYTYLFVLYFFVTDCHLSYIKLFADSYTAIPIGVTGINPEIGYVIASYFSVILTMAVKFALPIIIAQMLLEVCLGILMKAVPNIHLFAINIQAKNLLGLFLMFILASPMAGMIDKYLGLMFENLYNILPLIPGS